MEIVTYFTFNRHNTNRSLIMAFADLLVKQGFALLIPDETDYSSIPRLELMLQHSDCFIAIETDLAGDGSTIDASAVLFENSLASRVNKPRLIIMEAGLPDIAERELWNTIIIFNGNTVSVEHPSFLRRLNSFKQSIPPATLPTTFPRRRVGLVIDSTKNIDSIYSETALSVITKLLLQQGYEAKLIKLSFTHDPKFDNDIEKYEFLIVEGRSSLFSPQIAETIFSRCIPTVWLCHIRDNESIGTVRARELSSKVSGYELLLNGKRIHPVIFWEDINQLEANLSEQISIIKRNETYFVTHDEIDAFFSKLEQVSELKVIGMPGAPPKIFLSNSSTTSKILIKEIMKKLESERIEYFHYEKEEGIALGENWKKILTVEVQQCDIFIALISHDYTDSEWCMYEMKLALDRHEQDKVRIFPYYLYAKDATSDAELDPRLGSIQHHIILDSSSYQEIVNNIVKNYKAVCEVYY